MLMGEGGPLSPEARDARQQRVIAGRPGLRRRHRRPSRTWPPSGTASCCEILASGDLTPLDAWTPDEMTRIAGNSAHEVRTWIAGYAALGAAGRYTVQYSYYRPIRELIAGFGLTTVTLD